LLVVLLAMLGIVLLASLVVVYVAYPHRGQEVPTVPWIGEAMRRGVERLPTLDNQSSRAAARPKDAHDEPRWDQATGHPADHTTGHGPHHVADRDVHAEQSHR
jgi:hypothetical protein